MPPQYTSPIDLNYAVLTRYLPRLNEILTTAAYAHIYLWSSTSKTWSKAGFEGSLFVVSLSPPAPTAHDLTPKTQEYQLFLLNRYSLDNFSYQLRNPDYIDPDLGEIIMLRANESETSTNGTSNGNDMSEEDEEGKVYGLYIFSEPNTSTAGDREKLLRMMKHCATTFQTASAAVPLQAPVQQQQPQQGRSISLTELFQQQGPPQHQQQQQQGYYTQSGWGAPDMGVEGHLPQQQQQQQPYYSQPGNSGMGAGNSGGGDVLMNLFQKASDARLRGGGHTQGY